MSNRNGVWSLPAQYQAIADQDWTMAPGAPTGVSATAGNAQAEVSFTAPTFAGIPGTITQFKVTSSSGQTATGSASPITVTGLTNGSGVTFTAQAQNAIGLGKASDASSSVTPLAEVLSGLFSTHLYDGTGSNQTITNGVNLSGKGGMVWIKGRNATSDHALVDTVRGGANSIASNTTDAQRTDGAYGVTFNSNGFTSTGGNLNVNGREQVSWTFRKEPKFFDVVTYTGTQDGDKTISHSLNTTVGMAIIKRYDTAGYDWHVYHRSTGTSKYLLLNSTNAEASGSIVTATSNTSITLSQSNGMNTSGATYVVYLFAHNNNDGGFGPDSEDIIKCGTYTGAYPNDVTVSLGFEPQFLMFKNVDTTSSWGVFDSMRGMPLGDSESLAWESGNAENGVLGSGEAVEVNPDGFVVNSGLTSLNANGGRIIYMAIRRADQSTPTNPDDVFQAHTYTGDGSTRKYSLNITPDMVINVSRNISGDSLALNDRIRGKSRDLYTNGTDQEYFAGAAVGFQFDRTNGIEVPNFRITNTEPYLNLCWKRAIGYFDMVAYTGTGSARTVNHGLNVVPEMMWIKCRSNSDNWVVFHKDVGATKILQLNNDIAATTTSTRFNDTAPTSSVFTVGTDNEVNGSSRTYMAYLFASVSDVSKVGSYTGDGSSSQNIDCGFTTAGVEFLLIKSTSSGDWYIWDRIRGIASGNDPYSRFNNNSAETTNTDHIDTFTTGFTVNSSFNTNSEVYIFYAIAR